MTCTATACATPTPDGLHLCDPHEGELFALLGQIPDTLADAADTVARLDGHATTARHTATSGATSAPVNLEAVARVDALQHTIADYCGRLHAAIPAAGVASADYLRRRLPDLIRQPWAGEALDQIATAHRRLVAAIDRPPRSARSAPAKRTGAPGRSAPPPATRSHGAECAAPSTRPASSWVTPSATPGTTRRHWPPWSAPYAP